MEKIWYRQGWHPLSILLLPLSWLFRLVVFVRRAMYRYGWLKTASAPVPVIVIGNISVGGAGKTPLVIWLVALLKQHGFRPGVVSRGYGSEPLDVPRIVNPDDDPAQAGDEPVLIARRAACPVVIFRKRPLAIATLLRHFDCDVVISDDGMQHYAMARDIEIAVIDSQRGLGNRQCLPAGPLREPPARLRTVDFIVNKGGNGDITMQYQFGNAVSLLNTSKHKPLTGFADFPVHAVAGIGNPQGFFDLLTHVGLQVIPHPFPDHHRFAQTDLAFNDGLPVIMTEKDAIKCARFAHENHWTLPINAILPDDFAQTVLTTLKEVQ